MTGPPPMPRRFSLPLPTCISSVPPSSLLTPHPSAFQPGSCLLLHGANRGSAQSAGENLLALCAALPSPFPPSPRSNFQESYSAPAALSWSMFNCSVGMVHGQSGWDTGQILRETAEGTSLAPLPDFKSLPQSMEALELLNQMVGRKKNYFFWKHGQSAIFPPNFVLKNS